MNLEDLDKILWSHYKSKKAQDQSHAPSFEEVYVDEQLRYSRKFRPIMKMAAAAVILIGLAVVLKEFSTEQVRITVQQPTLNTQQLLPTSEYIWNWQSPTQSLLTMAEKTTIIEIQK